MVYHEFGKEQLVRYKIKGQARPFIDEDLQLQLPGLEDRQTKSEYYSHIYSHYFNQSHLPIATLPSEQELEQAMHDAQKSYEAWKQMQQELGHVFKMIAP